MLARMESTKRKDDGACDDEGGYKQQRKNPRRTEGKQHWTGRFGKCQVMGPSRPDDDRYTNHFDIIQLQCLLVYLKRPANIESHYVKNTNV